MIYVRGDTHGDLRALTDPRLAALTGNDKLVITGDFGFVLHNDLAQENSLDALERLPFEILFVDGNHECFPRLLEYPEVTRYGAPVRQLRRNIFWLQRGYLYTIEDRTFFTFGGAYSIDKAWRLDHQRVTGEQAWFAEELPSPEEYRRGIATLEGAMMQVDYILTHTAPRTIIPRVICKAPDPHENELNGFLDWVYHEVTFRKWYFGHFHMDLQVNDQMIACLDELHIIE